MVFSSAIFLFIFLPVVFLGNLLIRPLWAKNLFLTAASLIFYAFGEPVYVFLMIASAAMNYGFGRSLAAAERQGMRRFLMVLSVLCNLIILGTFKYAGFLVDNINHIAGLHLSVPEIALPVGISFFTFQAMSYVIDVYRNRDMYQKSFIKVLLYISFFPQLIAGPIVRWGEIEAQLDHRTITADGVVEGICRFVKGLAKKLLFANGLGRIADQVFDLNIGQYSMAVAWLGAICYALQIFYDFSGYSDMAIGLASMFGFHFQENFDHPYSADSIHGFWRRWHISLSSWFKEYVYIPLGGNRKGKPRTEVNKLIVFFLTGIWHGANWTFVIWGMIHGVMNVLEDTILPIRKCRFKWIGNLYTWIIAVTAFVMFRADTAAYGWQMIRAMFGNFFWDMSSGQFILERLDGYTITLLAVGILLSYPVTGGLARKSSKWREAHSMVWENLRYVGVLVLFLLCICSLASAAYNPFIYFRF